MVMMMMMHKILRTLTRDVSIGDPILRNFVGWKQVTLEHGWNAAVSKAHRSRPGINIALIIIIIISLCQGILE